MESRQNRTDTDRNANWTFWKLAPPERLSVGWCSCNQPCLDRTNGLFQSPKWLLDQRHLHALLRFSSRPMTLLWDDEVRWAAVRSSPNVKEDGCAEQEASFCEHLNSSIPVFSQCSSDLHSHVNILVEQPWAQQCRTLIRRFCSIWLLDSHLSPNNTASSPRSMN